MRVSSMPSNGPTVGSPRMFVAPSVNSTTIAQLGDAPIAGHWLNGGIGLAAAATPAVIRLSGSASERVTTLRASLRKGFRRDMSPPSPSILPYRSEREGGRFTEALEAYDVRHRARTLSPHGQGRKAAWRTPQLR